MLPCAHIFMSRLRPLLTQEPPPSFELRSNVPPPQAQGDRGWPRELSSPLPPAIELRSIVGSGWGDGADYKPRSAASRALRTQVSSRSVGILRSNATLPATNGPPPPPHPRSSEARSPGGGERCGDHFAICDRPPLAGEGAPSCVDPIAARARCPRCNVVARHDSNFETAELQPPVGNAVIQREAARFTALRRGWTAIPRP
jgi:hypothetical protein